MFLCAVADDAKNVICWRENVIWSAKAQEQFLSDRADLLKVVFFPFYGEWHKLMIINMKKNNNTKLGFNKMKAWLTMSSVVVLPQQYLIVGFNPFIH